MVSMATESTKARSALFSICYTSCAGDILFTEPDHTPRDAGDDT